MSRVPFEALSRSVSQTVRIVGKVISSDGKTARLELEPGKIVTVCAIAPDHYQSGFVEVICKVKTPTECEELKSVSFDSDFDLELYNNMLKYSSGRYSSLFMVVRA